MFSQGAAKPPLAARQPQAHSDLGAVRLRQGLEDVSHRSGIGGDPLERRRLRQHHLQRDRERRPLEVLCTENFSTVESWPADLAAYRGNPTAPGSAFGLVGESLLLSRAASASCFCLKASYSGVPGRGGIFFGVPPAH